ncbi:MAG: hypothetical protein L0Y71_20895 [Gemmataceae bacterium]|nr:hypothetical protein [Gemmataceae bacterium]
MMSLQAPLRGDDLLTAENRNATIPWLWEGMLAAGNITLLTSVWAAAGAGVGAIQVTCRGKCVGRAGNE